MSSQTEPSWCRTTLGEKVDGTFRWTIDKFKSRPEKCNEKLESSFFTVNGPGDLKTKWMLEIYPKGNLSNEGCVSVFLYTKVNFKVNAEYKIEILDEAGKVKEKFTCKIEVQEYDITGKTSNWGQWRWLECEQLNDPDLLPDGNLTLQCTITVFGTGKVLSGSDRDSDSNPDLTILSQKHLGEQLGKVLSDKQFSDIKILCEGQTFDCHKAILATRSPVFMTMLQTHMKEKETNTVTIDDFTVGVVDEMLNYIYTGAISNHDTISVIATELLAAADKYQLDLLKNICEKRLCSTLEMTNCVEYLVLGDMYQTFKLRRRAMEIAVENIDSIIDTDVFKDLFKQKPELAWEIMKASRN